jgi:ubiquinone/menaquinone biosynthesis C-methylase UbiE
VNTADRLVALFDHLGVTRAHIAAQLPGDVAGLVAAHPERVGGIVLCAPLWLDAEPFAPVGGRVMMIAGEYGPSEAATTRAWSRLPEAGRLLLDNYEAVGWSDIVKDCAGVITPQMTGFLAKHPVKPPRAKAAAGSHAGISYRVEGSGPALVLAPLFMAPTQWDAAMPALTEKFTVIRLGGRHLGQVTALEHRISLPTYRAMFRAIVDLIAPEPGESVLDVGCGTGSLSRLLAQWTGGANPITAVDVSPYLLREAAALAAEDGLDGAIAFAPGSAEALPFPDASFDAVFAVTVLEECDAERALAEIVRVTKPGGRVGIAVRASDIQPVWHMDLPDQIRSRLSPPPESVGHNGVADKSLYRRMKRAGLGNLHAFPFLQALDRPEGPIWRYLEEHVLSLLDAEGRSAWIAARDAAAGPDGLLLMANPMHCAVGRKG